MSSVAKGIQDSPPPLHFMSGRWQATLLGLVLVVHTGGRLAAFCAPDKVDSLTYSLAAYRLWQPSVSFADIVPDKPPGQAVLTGWVYRVCPGPPSRLALLPVESLFLLGAYAAIYGLGRRHLGASIATIVTLLFALTENIYNATDYTTDGFTLAECYLALPMLLAVSLYLAEPRRFWHGLGRGIALGVAIGIKQTAVGLLLVLLVHDICLRHDRDWRATRTAWMATIAGLAVGSSPVWGVLVAHGWLTQHLQDLMQLSTSRAGARGTTWPAFSRLQPLLPIAWFVAVGAAAAFASRVDRVKTAEPQQPTPLRDLATLAGVWLAVEACIAAILPNPSAHYYQQLAAPGSLLAGAALYAVTMKMGCWSPELRTSAMHSILATGIALAIYAVIPLAHLAHVRAAWPDRAVEVQLFEQSLQTDTLGRTIRQIREKHAAQ